MDSKGIEEIEPNARGVKAIWSPHTGIVSFREVTKSYARDFTSLGGHMHYGFRVVAVRSSGNANNDLVVKSGTYEEVQM